MDIVMGSFNVYVLNTKQDDTSNTKKDQKCEKIANLIKEEKFDIIALQEIQTDNAVERIAHYLNGNDSNSPYDYCHCSSLYDELNNSPLGLRNRNGSKFKSDYGFIWNSRKVSLYCEEALYKALDDCERKEWDSFLERIVDILIKTYKEIMAQGGQKSGLFAKLPQGESLGQYREKLLTTLHQTLRPPLIACFKPNDFFGSLLHEIRVINTHTQWKKGRSDDRSSKQIRLEEMRFIQGHLHNAVNTLRTGSFNTVYTVIAGDFNLSIDELAPIYTDVTKLFGNHRMKTIQEEASTCKWDKEQEMFSRRSNYDHFAYDANRIDELVPGGAKPININKDNFLIGEEEGPVSDHVPIKMTLQF